MTTITYRAGSADNLRLRPKVPDGADQPVAVQLRVAAGTACITLDAVQIDDGFEVALSGLDLPPRLYRASVWYDSGDGWRFATDFNLYIQGGC